MKYVYKLNRINEVKFKKFCVKFMNDKNLIMVLEFSYNVLDY